MIDVLTTLLKVGSVFVILAGFAWWARRHGAKNGRRDVIEVVSKAQVAGRSSVAVVKVGDRSYLLGVTESQVNLLADIAPGQLPAAPADETVGGSFAAHLANATDPAKARPGGATEQPQTVGEAVLVTARRIRAARQDRRARKNAAPAATAQPAATPTVRTQAAAKATSPKAARTTTTTTTPSAKKAKTSSPTPSKTLGKKPAAKNSGTKRAPGKAYTQKGARR